MLYDINVKLEEKELEGITLTDWAPKYYKQQVVEGMNYEIAYL